jgi:putative glutamine amidotransferase
MRPCIGLTLDTDEANREYRLARAYADAVLAAGGLPVPITYGDDSAAGAYLALCQAIVITGGDFDIPPERYGEARRACCGREKAGRTTFEWALCEAALAGRVPILGVCGGMQLMNVIRGGTLYQDLGEDMGVRTHEQPPPKDTPSHPVEIVPDSLLARLVGKQPLPVNSTHHQAVRRVGAGVLVSARAPDGVVEAIELPDLPFAIGVQWHPERVLVHDSRHLGLWRGLVEAAEDLRLQR